MRSRVPARNASADVDEGFTLVEVVVALLLMSIVLMAGGAFMVRTLSTSSAMTGSQGAVLAANQVMEQIRAINPKADSNAISPLVYGRSKSDVVLQWVGLDASDTYTGAGSTTFDTHTYEPSKPLSVPLRRIITLNKQEYTVDALIGTCTRPDRAATCTNVGAGDEFYRVVVRATWSPGGDRKCPSSSCSYIMSSLIDASAEPQFNTNQKPVAISDTVTTPVDAPLNIGVAANDNGDFGTSGTTVVTSGPTSPATAVADSLFFVRYTPKAGASGKDSFTYYVLDQAGRSSNVATVNVSILPVSANDTANTVIGASPINSAVLANDKGTGLSLVSLSTPAFGSAVINSNQIRYTPPLIGSGTVTVTYTAQDSSLQQYTGTLTIKVAGPTPVPMGTATTFSVLTATSVTNTGASTLSGGLAAVSSVTGFPPGIVSGTKNVADATANSARNAFTTAYSDAAGRTAGGTVSGDLNGKTLIPGIYKSGSGLALTGTVTLDGGGDPNAVFIVQITGNLNVAASSTVTLVNGATAANVFWQVTGVSGIGASSSFAGTLLSNGAVTLGTGAQVRGRVQSNAAVTLATNTFP